VKENYAIASARAAKSGCAKTEVMKILAQMYAIAANDIT